VPRYELRARPEAEPVLAGWIASAGTLAAFARASPDSSTLVGRGAVHVLPSPLTDGAEWVVRPYRRGGALARALGDRYLRAGEPRPFREYDLALELAARGVSTAPAVGAAVYPSGAVYQGELVTERVPGAVDLAALLFGPDAPSVAASREEAMAAAGRLVRVAHDAGLRHPDLNLKNLLVLAAPGGGTEAVIIDLDRGRLGSRVPDPVRRRMLARFWRSAAKWERRTGNPLPDTVRSSFQDGYASG
jgi:3-deoxy-D-manno-octulosonic acid kinase